MELPSSFTTFLTAIRPTDDQSKDLQTGHTTLRERLHKDPTLAPIIVSDFLQGSYRRATAVRPKSGKRSDVDIIVVTKLDSEEYTPEAALQVFVPFLDKHYKDKYEIQGRSIGIELSYVDLDLVITAAPSEAEQGILKAQSVTTDETLEEVKDWRLVQSWVPYSERRTLSGQLLMKAAVTEAEWKSVPLLIPDREAGCWTETDPLAQIRWTWDMNKAANTHYVNVVKALKWWRRVKHATPAYPKGYPVEHLIGQSCPEGINSVAQGVTLTLEAITASYSLYAALKQVPVMPDHGVPTHDVLKRITGEDFAEFYNQVKEAALIARRALDCETSHASSEAWQELFGSKFPLSPEEGGKSGGFTPRNSETTIAGGRFAYTRGCFS